MKKICLLLIAAFISFFLLQPKGQTGNRDDQYFQLYEKAEAYFNGSADEYTDSVALSYYLQFAQHVKPSHENALWLYNCHERMGILMQGLGYTSQESLQEFYTSLQFWKQYQLPDSVLFRLLLSAGNAHYAEGLLDSSAYYFSRAEKIILHYPNAGLAGDLYNSQGALYNELGDFKQSGNYFSKALEITKQTRPELKEAIFAMSANIASALRLSGEFDAAIRAYSKLLQPGAVQTPVLINLSRIYISKKKPDSALFFLRQIIPNTYTNYLTYYNSWALAYMQKNDAAGAAMYLSKADSVFKLRKGNIKSSNYGLTCKYLGDLTMMNQNPRAALDYYQQAIIQLDYTFNEANVYINPINFMGDFTSYDLFEALLAKANCFAAIFHQHPVNDAFKGAADTYDAAFKLADYIEKSIDNDEARRFVADKIFAGYTTAIDFVMQSYARQKNDSLIDLTLKWISKSRAASLAVSLKENTIKRFAGLPDSLLQKEKNIKINISRLKLQLQQTPDSTGQKDLLSETGSLELQLNRLINRYRQYPAYYQQKFASDSFSVSALQKSIPDNQTAVICYFRGKNDMLSFIIKQNEIIYTPLSSDTALFAMLENFSSALKRMNAGSENNINNAAKFICSALVSPLTKELDNIESLIIIPDRDLINIPFEALRMDDNRYMVEQYAITYQYALPFLQLSPKQPDNQDAIAFAPFSVSGLQNSVLKKLPSSIDEISSFKAGAQVMGPDATKKNFLLKVEDAAVMHLATHAAVNYDNPSASYIAFYPVNDADSSYKLFAHELYNLQLPKAHLVFLSACETGSGKMSQSEGALSLSRAFAYAGCPNIITSLWKAEDKSTAYISKKFYEYSENGYTYAAALQHAKKDLLADASMSQFHSPAYWSHLILTGDMQPAAASPVFIWLLAAGSAFVIFAVVVFNKRKQRNTVL